MTDMIIQGLLLTAWWFTLGLFGSAVRHDSPTGLYIFSPILAGLTLALVYL